MKQITLRSQLLKDSFIKTISLYIYPTVQLTSVCVLIVPKLAMFFEVNHVLKQLLHNHKGSISHPIMPLVINNLGVDTHTHASRPVRAWL